MYLLTTFFCSLLNVFASASHYNLNGLPQLAFQLDQSRTIIATRRTDTYPALNGLHFYNEKFEKLESLDFNLYAPAHMLKLDNTKFAVVSYHTRNPHWYQSTKVSIFAKSFAHKIGFQKVKEIDFSKQLYSLKVLPNGNYIISMRCYESGSCTKLMVTDDAFNPIWEKRYPGALHYRLELTEDKIVFAYGVFGSGQSETDSIRVLNFNGEEIAAPYPFDGYDLAILENGTVAVYKSFNHVQVLDLITKEEQYSYNLGGNTGGSVELLALANGGLLVYDHMDGNFFFDSKLNLLNLIPKLGKVDGFNTNPILDRNGDVLFASNKLVRECRDTEFGERCDSVEKYGRIFRFSKDGQDQGLRLNTKKLTGHRKSGVYDFFNTESVIYPLLDGRTLVLTVDGFSIYSTI